MDDIVKMAILPSNLLISSLFLGAVLLCFRSTRRASKIPFALALLLYVVFGSGPVSYGLLGGLEHQNPRLDAHIDDLDVHSIVILTGYGEPDSFRPISSQLNAASIYRVVEALHILHRDTSRTIIVSGSGQVSRLMKALMLELGVDGKQIQIDDQAGSTLESAANISALLKDKRFFLVTSAGHMPRAMLNFQHAGTKPIPSPTHFLTRRNLFATGYLPTPVHLVLSDFAIAEYAAILRNNLQF